MAKIIVDRDVPVRMRDGVTLRADVYRPSRAGPLPVLLHRIPYNKSDARPAASLMFNPLRAAEHGYAVVLQDCRGRFASKGEFAPMHREIPDGYDTVEWCARQPWSNGKVGIYGSSYMGVTTWMTVISAPPHLEAAFVRMTGANYHDGWVYSGGAYELGFNLRYALSLCWNACARLPAEKRKAPLEQTNAMALDIWSAYRHLPLADMPLFKSLAPYYLDWLAHPSYDDYWREIDVGAHLDDIKIPVLQMSGWYDGFLRGHITTFPQIGQRGTEKARRSQKLIIGPWTHYAYLTPTPSRIGDAEFGMAAIPDVETLSFRWFDRWLKGMDTGVENDPPVRIFVMGANVWRDEASWPPQGATETAWYLHSQGHANTSQGDGVLETSLPGQKTPDSYTYNPADPTPTCGGRVLMQEVGNIVGEGVKDQRPVEERTDVLVYTSPILMQDVEVTGNVRLKLWAASSARDTDFTGKLVDVHPDGYAGIVAEGILRARYRNSMSQPELLEPGQAYELDIDLWATSQLFKRGHRIRLEVSSSNFPRFDRNLNTGEDNATASRMEVAVQTIYHDAARPSHIILPVIGQRS